MGSKKSKAELEAELTVLKRTKFADGWVTVATSLFRYGALVLLARYAYMSVEALAGKATMADIGVSFLGKFEVSVAIAWLSGICGVAYGWQQRKLRRDTVERLQGRIAILEARQDPGRTSSRLTQRGDSRPEDVQ